MVFIENPSQSLPHLLSLCEEYGRLSGFKINWSKSALLHLNDSACNSTISASIPIVKQFKYLGIEVFPCLNQIVKHNYSVALTNVLKDMERWMGLPMSFQACISVVKMNVLPRINSVSSMLPLSSPSDYWHKLQSAVSKFMWKGKQPCLKMSTLQRRKEDGGLSVPNFKLYFWSSVLRPLLTWFDSDTSVCWCTLESAMTEPWSLHDILFANISNKQCQLHFGPIISHLIKTWRLAESYCHVSCNWHTLSPLFNNKALLIGGRPITAPQWEQREVHYLKDIFSEVGLLPFSDLQNGFSLPCSSFFFYLQLRSALKAYGVPWQESLPIHPIRKWFTMQPKASGMVSRIYQFLVIPSRLALPIERVWERDYPDLNTDLDWHDVWSNIPEVSRNPDHQQIHYNFIHRTYLTPWQCITWK